MPRVQVYIPDDVSNALAHGARSILLGKTAFVRAILCAAAREIGTPESPDKAPCRDGQTRGEVAHAPAA